MQKGAADPAIKEKGLAFVETLEKAKNKEIVAQIGEKKADVDLAVKELAMEDVALKGKVKEPE